MKNLKKLFCMLILVSILAFSLALSVSANSPAPADHLTVILSNLPGDAVYADLLVKYNENEKAIKLLLEGINISTATPSAVFRSDLMLKLSECYEKSGQAEKALAYYKQYKKETDSLFNIEKERAADELRVKYNIERAENEAKQSKLELLQKGENNNDK